MEPYLRSVDHEVQHTKYRIGLQTIVNYLDANPPQTDAFSHLMVAAVKISLQSTTIGQSIQHTTEQWFENTALGLKGKIDLVHGPTQLIDYKSGSKKSAKEVVKNSAIESPTDKPNFQALLYLTHQRTERPDRATSVHVLPLPRNTR